jgi:nickel-dependent lactate racemase
LADGTPVRLAREVLDADLVVTVASVQHHYFAGFGGGPKMIFPGVAGYEEIQRNHSRVIRLDATPAVRDDRCEPGALEGNPVAEEIRHVAHRCPPSMEICMVAGRGGVSWAAAGDFGAPFAAAVARAREWFEVKPVRLARGVASAGGAPVDQTVIQAHKALDAACRFLVDGGELLYLARMELGGGSPAVEPFLRDPDPDRIVEALAQEYVQYGHTTLRLLEKTRRFRVRLVSDLDPDLARRLGFEPVSEPQPVLAQWRRESRGPVGVMTERPVYPRTAAIVEPD